MWVTYLLNEKVFLIVIVFTVKNGNFIETNIRFYALEYEFILEQSSAVVDSAKRFKNIF